MEEFEISTGMNQLHWLHSMSRIRILEEEIMRLRAEEEIVGSVHLCNGQEAIAVGVCSALDGGDALFATYRGHGWALARGVSPAGILGELLARNTGVNGGRGGSAHFSDPESGFFGENSIVGAGAPIAVGAALSFKHRGERHVSVSVFGDGAMNQGGVTEAMNFAAAFDLPVIFICENNKYSELTPIEAMVRKPDLAGRAAALGIPTVQMDGNSPSEVATAASLAVAAARSGTGPTFIEARTRRIVGHYIGDIQHYRPKGELEQDIAREPINRLRRELAAAGVPRETISAAENRARSEIEQAVQVALSSAPADTANAGRHLYA